MFAYGIRLRRPETTMTWREFSALLSNLPGDSQFSQMIYVRKADGDEYKALGPSQLRLRDAWYAWVNEQAATSANGDSTANLEKLFQSFFG